MGDTQQGTNVDRNIIQPQQKSLRPLNNEFVQQRLPTVYPVLNAGLLYPIFLVLSLLFIPLGVGIYLFAEGIQEKTIDYTNCISEEISNRTCSDILKSSTVETATSINCPPPTQQYVVPKCSCKVPFTLEEDMLGTVYMYYALTNYYQNHLEFYRSRDDNQLKGNIGTFTKNGGYKNPSDSCKPYAYAYDENDGRCKPIFPCGMQANTMFFDVLKLSHFDDEQEESLVPLLRTGIARNADKTKFKNPMQLRNPKDPIWGVFSKPPAWRKNIWELDADKSNNGVENEDFIIWMTTAAFPNFRKIHRIVQKSTPYEKGLPAGSYFLLVDYNIDASKFNGTKSVILTTSKMTAAKNYFLGYAFFTTGIILLICFIVFFILHMFTRKRYLQFKMD